MRRILLQNGRIWDGEKFFWGDVFVHGKMIAKIGTHIEERADFVYDAEGDFIVPGLVDTHVHFKGISSEKYGIQAEMSCLPFGVTAACDAGGGRGDLALLDSFAVKNRIFVGIDIKDNHAHFDRTEALFPKYGDRAIGIKVYFDKGISEVSDSTPLREAAEYARARGTRLMVHTTGTPVPMEEIANTLSKGDIITHPYHGGENACTENDFAVFKIAKEKGIIIDAGFAGHVHTDFKNFEKAMQNGFLPDTISTDITCASAYMRGGRFGMTMCMSMAKTMGIQEADIFRAVTSGPAKVLGMEESCGYLQEGRTADIAVLSYTEEPFDLTDKAGNRLRDKMGYRCLLTVCDGQIVYRA